MFDLQTGLFLVDLSRVRLVRSGPIVQCLWPVIMCVYSKELFFQLVIFDFGNFGALQLTVKSLKLSTT